MEGKPVVVPIDPDLLSQEEKKGALEAVNLIKEKQDGNLKGGRAQMERNSESMLKKGILSHPLLCL